MYLTSTLFVFQSSFRHLNRRKPSARPFRKSHDKGRYDVTMQGNNSTDSSPEIQRQVSIDLVDTFGSVATVRGIQPAYINTENTERYSIVPKIFVIVQNKNTHRYKNNKIKKTNKKKTTKKTNKQKNNNNNNNTCFKYNLMSMFTRNFKLYYHLPHYVQIQQTTN